MSAERPPVEQRPSGPRSRRMKPTAIWAYDSPHLYDLSCWVSCLRLHVKMQPATLDAGHRVKQDVFHTSKRLSPGRAGDNTALGSRVQVVRLRIGKMRNRH